MTGADRHAAHKATRPTSRWVGWSTSSVSRVLSRVAVACATPTIIPLRRPLPIASSSLPAGGERVTLCRSRLALRSACRPMWPCSRWGLPCRLRHRRRGGLLPRRFTLTRRIARAIGRAVCSLLHFPSRSRDRALPGIALFGARTFLPHPRPSREEVVDAGDRLVGVDGRQHEASLVATQAAPAELQRALQT
jgi:hypothetical protein